MQITWKMGLVAFILSCVVSTACAQIFVEGKVTKEPWQNKYYQIKVNNVQYMVMPDVKVMLNREEGKSYTPTKIEEQLRSIRMGTTVWMSIEGNRVYQIWEEK